MLFIILFFSLVHLHLLHYHNFADLVFLHNLPEEENDFFQEFPFVHSKTAVGDVVTFESWNTIHCNPIPKLWDSRKAVFWYSCEEGILVDESGVNHQLNLWTLHTGDSKL
jgi:hypothetical protein